MIKAETQIEFGPATVSGGVYTGLPVSGQIVQHFEFLDSPKQSAGADFETDIAPGIKIKAQEGTPVQAPAPGYVETSSFNDAIGWHVILKHDDGTYTLYGHLADAFSARTGEQLERGGFIGYVGSTGQTGEPGLLWAHATGAHFSANSVMNPLDSVVDKLSTLDTPHERRDEYISGDSQRAQFEPNPGGRGWMPGVEYIPTQAFGYASVKPGTMKPIAVMSQITQGHQENVIAWALERPPATTTSSHFSISREGRIIQHVSIFDPAWNIWSENLEEVGLRHLNKDPEEILHPNMLFVQIQHEGFSHGTNGANDIYSVDNPVPEAMIQATIKVHRWILEQLGREPGADVVVSSKDVRRLGDVWPRERIINEIKEPTAIPVVADIQADYAADSPDAEDLLDIKNNINAFARLIAARNVEPPLSIGLFGDWGSGKSFFMRKLQDRITEIAENAKASRRPQREIAYYKHIVQIEFNAWHYVEGNLWASLVTHIFDNLKASRDEKRTLVEERQKFFLEKLQDAEELVEGATEKEKELTDELKEKAGEVKEYDKAVEKDQETLGDKLKKLATLGGMALDIFYKDLAATDTDEAKEIKTAFEQVGKDINTAKETISEFNKSAGKLVQNVRQMGPVLSSLILAKDRGKRMMQLAIIIIVLPGLIGGLGAFVINTLSLQALLPKISAGLATVITMIAGGTEWLRRQSVWWNKWRERIEKGRQTVDVVREGLENDVRELKEKLALTKAKKKAHQDRMQEIRAELKRITPGYLLREFIVDRAESDDYHEYLGLPALIRADFERLSLNIQELNRKIEQDTGDKESKDEQEMLINRIVLYIDDLDRCEPKDVVNVLQAVHLLLAFPLFAVVVGVDARWVSNSLKNHYRELLKSPGKFTNQDESLGRQATPQDYLEKIFQIPFRIKRLGEGGKANLINGLTKKARLRTLSEEKQWLHTQPDKPDDTSEDDLDKIGEGNRIARQIQKPLPKRRPFDEEENESGFNLNPTSLTIYKGEHTFMLELSPLLGHSPRALKRFINVYRLIKSGLSETEHEHFLEGKRCEARYQIVMFLLAIVTGLPNFSNRFFAELISTNDENKGKEIEATMDLKQFLIKLKKDQLMGKSAELKQLSNWTSSIVKKDNIAWNTASVADLAREAVLVARYSFRVENV